MKRFHIHYIYSFYILLIVLIAYCDFGMPVTTFAQTPDHASDVSHETTIPVGAQRLISAYPDQKLRYADNQILFPDGTAIPYDDGKTKSFEEKLDDSDIEDMFSMPYRPEHEPDYLEDPGRSRCEALFKKMYGQDAKTVKQSLVTVSWFGQTVKFNKTNGAARQLAKVADEINTQHPELKKYMKSSGTFYWRKVRGTNRLSSHSYGTAIDIAVHESDYWRWAAPKATETDTVPYRNRIPLELVRVFEKHGFIWGGRWYHFDTMHFEYRPELIEGFTPESQP